MQNHKSRPNDNFDAIAISIANPETMLSWSHGEVTKPETINYRTQKPERDGLFCEKIFGPTKNWECYCGKYKRIRYKGVVCEKCGVEVTHSSVRRQRMGHIKLAVPITHTWFVRSTPSRIGLFLDLSVKQIEQLIYFAAYVVKDIDEDAREEALKDLDREFKNHKNRIIDEYEQSVEKIKQETAGNKEARSSHLAKLEKEHAEEVEDLTDQHSVASKELKNLAVGQIITEIQYRDLSMKFGQVFQAGTGAETIRDLLSRINLEEFIAENEEEMKKCSEQRQKKILKRIQLARAFQQAGTRPEWMVVTILPVVPPDLRPMVQLDGGRFAASDLNDLYRRVINRNNRLRKLIEIGAPEVICRNEKRMLQEAVDTLLNNSPRAGKTVLTSGDRRKLRSLSDMLKGKQGRFRQNLLGKRVDYSGRSVIVVGPNLNMPECGIPKLMALKLFKPFVIGKLIKKGSAHNVKNAEKIIQKGEKEVWDILEEITKDHFVLLNRAPTLHRLGIQAFRPVLIEGKAIQIHPLVCAAFNADFDGDQMAVHVPLSKQAQAEAKQLISCDKNLLKPSAGEPIINASQDMILGCFYLTYSSDEARKGDGKIYESTDSVLMDYEMDNVHPQAKIKVRTEEGEMLETTVGRVIFHENVTKPAKMPFQNSPQNKGALKRLVSECFNTHDMETAVKMSDAIKKLGFHFGMKSGISISQDDVVVPEGRIEIIEAASERARHIHNQWWKGHLTLDERYLENVRLWSEVKKEISNKLKADYPENNIFYMVQSGARGNWGQLTQLAGIKGLVANPSGRTIELPIKSNLKDGFSVLEFFIATHGGRKGKSDTALKTAEAGYLTRRLVDSVQDIIIREEDCGQTDVHMVNKAESEKIGESFYARIFGRTLAADLKDKKGNLIAKRNDVIDQDLLAKIKKSDIEEAPIRSTLSCQTREGICQKCYGQDLGSNKLVKPGTPVGIIAAQSIGEPGTQLTMRTFHMGGVAGEGDITQGLERVEELFEARAPKTPAILCDIAGEVKIKKAAGHITISVLGEKAVEKSYQFAAGQKTALKKGDEVKEKQILASAVQGGSAIRADFNGKITEITDDVITIKSLEAPNREYEISSQITPLVKNGEKITPGTAITKGHYNLREYMDLTSVYDAQRYILREVQTIYASQGQTINDKHLEIIVREMFSNARIVDAGDSLLLAGENTNYFKVQEINDELTNDKKRPVRYERLLLGLTRAALKTDSWLSAASFQETIRVLVEAATTKKIDTLDGLKENVIIGRLIPAGEQYRKLNEIEDPDDQLEEQLA